MKKTIILTSLLFFNTFAIAADIKGPVIKTTETLYSVTHKFGEEELEPRRSEDVVVRYYNADGNICHSRKLDWKGDRKTEVSSIYNNGEKKIIESKPKATIDGVIYDTVKIQILTYEKGKVVKNITLQPRKKSDNLGSYYDTVAMVTCTYDSSGREKDICEYKDNKLTKRTKYEYTPNGYKQFIYNSEGVLTLESEKKGNVLEIVSHTNPQVARIVYNSKGQKIEETNGFKAANGVAGTTKHYEYDKYGNVTSVYTGFESSLRRTGERRYTNERRRDEHTFKYEYDAYGNMTSFTAQGRKVIVDIVYADANASVEQLIRDDVQKYDKELEKEVARLRKEQAEEAKKQARKKQLSDMLAKDRTYRQTLSDRRKKIYEYLQRKFIFKPHASEYPNIYATIVHIADKYTPLSNDILKDARYYHLYYHPIEDYYAQMLKLINAQKILIETVSDPKNKKEMKKLDASLKRAETYQMSEQLLLEWLKGKNYNVEFTTNYYSKSNGTYLVVGESIIHRAASVYISRLVNQELGIYTNEGRQKILDIIKFLAQLTSDKSLQEDKNKLVKELEETGNVNLHDPYGEINALIFAEFLMRHGIIIQPNVIN